ncbi:MAG: hypothetical protein BJ554DRAFT_8221 [Olpidium bornovanus]|uniref:Uncharacterized protein n=1 Tax=Olpidium bornovanus TaxID=278681 RepID=A0A8H8A284_9FUNG|nr:MAG: hypothetical protein BJ554DRAFT_8221 [Olpidium bornovanus]
MRFRGCLCGGSSPVRLHVEGSSRSPDGLPRTDGTVWHGRAGGDRERRRLLEDDLASSTTRSWDAGSAVAGEPPPPHDCRLYDVDVHRHPTLPKTSGVENTCFAG